MICFAIAVVVLIVLVGLNGAAQALEYQTSMPNTRILDVLPLRILFFASSNEEFLEWARFENHAQLVSQYSGEWIIVHSNKSVDLRWVFEGTSSTVEQVFCKLPSRLDVFRNGCSKCIVAYFAGHPLAADPTWLTFYLEHDVYIKNTARLVAQLENIVAIHRNTDMDIHVHKLVGRDIRMWRCMFRSHLCNNDTHRINGVSIYDTSRLRLLLRRELAPLSDSENMSDVLRTVIERKIDCNFWDQYIRKLLLPHLEDRVIEHDAMCICSSCREDQMIKMFLRTDCVLYHAVIKNRKMFDMHNVLRAFFSG